MNLLPVHSRSLLTRPVACLFVIPMLALSVLLLGCSSVTKLSTPVGSSSSSNGSGSSGSASAESSSGGSVDQAVQEGRYRIFPGDRIELTVYQEEDLNTVVTVEQDGTAVFPLLGSVNIAGRSLSGAARVVEEAYAEDYLVNPRVNLSVAEYSPRNFTIFGQVNRPGVHEIPVGSDVTLLEAIGRAGGYTGIAKPSSIQVKRKVDGQTQVFQVNANAMARGSSPETFNVKPGDVITVPESAF